MVVTITLFLGILFPLIEFFGILIFFWIFIRILGFAKPLFQGILSLFH